MLKRCFVADLKKSWYQYFIVIALLTIICVVGVAAFTLDRTIFDYMTYDDEKYMDISTGYISNKEIYDELQSQGKIIGKISHLGTFHCVQNSAITLFQAPLSKGKWFDGKGIQLIVKSSLADQYPIGSKVNVGIGKEAYATVIGHFKYDRVLRLDNAYVIENSVIGTVSYDSLDDIYYSEYHDDIFSECIVARLTADEVNEYRKQGNFYLNNVSEEFNRYYLGSSSQIALVVYVFYSLFAGTFVIILVTTLAGGELQKRRIAISMVCGVNQKSLMITEVIKSVISFAVSSILATILVFNVQGGEIFKLHQEHLYKGVLIMLGTAAIICLVNIIKIKRTNMLDIIGGK